MDKEVNVPLNLPIDNVALLTVRPLHESLLVESSGQKMNCVRKHLVLS